MRLFQRLPDKRWRVRIRNERGKWTERVATTNKRESEAYARRLVVQYAEAAQQRADPYAEHLARPIGEHVKEFVATLKARERGAHHTNNTCSRVERVIKECKWKTLDDVDADQLSRALKRWRDNEGLGPASSNHYLRAAKSFELWCEAESRVPRRRLAHLRAIPNKQPRRVRRALSAAEEARLLSVTEKSTIDRNGLDGPTRALIYRVSLATGLRLGEIAALTPEDVLLNRVPCPAIRVRANISKNAKEALLPLRSDVVAPLRHEIARARPGRSIFPGSWRWRASAIMQADLAEAGIDYRDAEGRVVDFHALRHTAVTNWVRAGLHVKQCQALARHSNVQLTLGVYSHVECDELAAEVEKTIQHKKDEQHTGNTKAAG